MKMTRYSERQILAILRQAEGGVLVGELCREHGMHCPAGYCAAMSREEATRRSTNGGLSMGACTARQGIAQRCPESGFIDDCSDKSLGR